MEEKGKRRTRLIVGIFEHAVDEKGRIVVPARWRVGMGTDLYVSPHPNGALVVMTEEEFCAIQAKIDASLTQTAERTNLKRYLSFNTHVTQLDKQGRISLNEGLMAHAGIRPGDAVKLGGNTSRFEIYSTENWPRVKDTFTESSHRVGHMIEY